MGLLYFISTDGNTKVGMDIEEDITVSYPSKVSKSSNMSGTSVSDEVIEGNILISAKGVVTYAKLPHQIENLNPVDFQKQIQLTRRNRQKFTLYVKDNGLPLLQNYDNCVVSNVSVTASKAVDALDISIQFEQVFVSDSATTAYLAPISKEADKPTTASTTSSGDTSKTDVGATIFRSAADGVISLIPTGE